MPKINYKVLNAWNKILETIPGSKLLLKTKTLGYEKEREYYLKRFKDYGIPEERLILKGFEASVKNHLELYSQIDIALDTFPYNGTTTTFEALWMGVPVITLVGDRHASRVGKSILFNLNLNGLITNTEYEYVKTALFLAGNTKILKNLRSGLRYALKTSPFCKEKQFTQHIENAYDKAFCNLTA